MQIIRLIIRARYTFTSVHSLFVVGVKRLCDTSHKFRSETDLLYRKIFPNFSA